MTISLIDAIHLARSFDGPNAVPVMTRKGKSLRLLPSARRATGIVAADLLTAAQRAAAGIPPTAYAMKGAGGWAIYTLPRFDGAPARAYSGTRAPIAKSQRRAGGKHVIRGW